MKRALFFIVGVLLWFGGLALMFAGLEMTYEDGFVAVLSIFPGVGVAGIGVVMMELAFD
jgi:hypothetical protein